MTKPDDALSLAQMIAATAQTAPAQKSGSTSLDIVCLPVRLPRTVRKELGKLAEANGMSVSMCINLLIDSYLQSQGRAGYGKLAPWYADYALRAKNKGH